MRLQVTTQAHDKFATFTVEDASTGEVLLPLIEAEFKMASNRQRLSFQGKPLDVKQPLSAAGIKDDDMIVVTDAGPQTGQLTLDLLPREAFASPALFQQVVQANPPALQQLLHDDPDLAQAVLSPDTAMITAIFQTRNAEANRRRQAEQQQMARINANPFDPDAQRLIEEQIRQQAIMENYAHAYEHNPESFGRVLMLYVPCRINNAEVVAFVDSGAQSTIMSESCARRCGIMRLLDTRFASIAKGVGTAKILGRVHAAHVQMGNAHFQSSICIMENFDVDLLFGLDQLKRHQAVIDLRENCLRISEQAIPFLSEKDLPAHYREHNEQKMGGSGTPSGASSSSGSSSAARAPSAAGAAISAAGSSAAATVGAGSSASGRSAPLTAAGAAALARAAGTGIAGPGAAPMSGVVGTNASSSSASSGSHSAGSVPAVGVPPQQQRPAPGAFPEDKIQRLVAIGNFPRAQVVQALTACGGNEEMAASLLFAQMGGGF